jgi:hypothetical protein
MALAVLLIFAARSPVQAQTVASISLQPSAADLAPDETVTLDIMVDDNIQSLYGAQFQLTFDSATLQVVDANPDANQGAAAGPVAVGPLLSAELLETAGADFVVGQNRADNARGTIDFTIAQLNPAAPVDRGGVLASVTFQAVSGGHSDLSLANVLLSNRKGELIPASVSGGGIDVALPEAAEPVEPDPPAAVEPEPEPVEPPVVPAETPAGGLSNNLMMIIIAAAVGVVILGLGGFMLSRRGKSAPPAAA